MNKNQNYDIYEELCDMHASLFLSLKVINDITQNYKLISKLHEFYVINKCQLNFRFFMG